MQTQLVYLETLAPLHLGERGVGLEETNVVARADTVFSALCMVFREHYGRDALESLISQFPRRERNDVTPPFVLSSAFPFVKLKDERRLPLFPRPLIAPRGIDPTDQAVMKSLRQVAFVSWPIFEAWLAGGTSLIARAVSEKETLLQEKKIWVTPQEAAEIRASFEVDENNQVWLWRVGEVPRVTVDRIDSKSEIYQAGRVRFVPGCGLWLGFQWLDTSTDWSTTITGLLTILGDAGLGGERSAGHGQFRVAYSEFIDLPAEGRRFVTLSPCWPTNADEAATLLDRNAQYSLVPRRGWMGSPDPDGRRLRRKSVRMLGDGSVLSAIPGLPYPGGLADVTPDIFKAHRVYRYGIALPVGITREAN